jgi:hypothetical protein
VIAEMDRIIRELKVLIQKGDCLPLEDAAHRLKELCGRLEADELKHRVLK